MHGKSQINTSNSEQQLISYTETTLFFQDFQKQMQKYDFGYVFRVPGNSLRTWLVSVKQVLYPVPSMETRQRLTASPVETDETQLLLFLEVKERWLETEALNDDSFIEPDERSLFDIRMKNRKHGTALWMVFLMGAQESKKLQTM